MANLVRTVIDNGDVIVERGEFEDGLLEFAGADTFVAGTIIARNTSNDKFQLYVKGGSSNGNGVPVAILVNEEVRTGVGDNPVRLMMDGIVNEKRLVIDADGDNSNVDGAVRDLLRQTGIVPIPVEQLKREDNPQPSESDS